MSRKIFALVLALVLGSSLLNGQRKKKKKEEETQTLALPQEPPGAVTAETARLEFIISPLSSKGLLSQQVRDALRFLRDRARGGNIVKLRAFVAGTGDQRRVQAIVSETFTDKHQPIPVLITIQAGGLPAEGAQVVMEATIVGRKTVNPNGLGFISGLAASASGAPENVLPLLEASIADLNKATRQAGSDPAGMLRVTCFLSSTDRIHDIYAKLASAFPDAALNAIQAQRLHQKGFAECEGVVRLRAKPASEVVFLPGTPNFARAALVGADRIVLTGSQLAFRYQDSDVRLAFERMSKILLSAHASMKLVVFSSIYPVTARMADNIRAIRFEFYDKDHPPASTMTPIEGLPSMDASFALELIAIPSQ